MSKTIQIPDDFGPDDERDAPLLAFLGDGDDGRDVLKPVAYDEHGNALYAPPGHRYRLSFDWWGDAS